MRITKIEITNYKAFEGTYTFELNDKQHTNLLVYGENGSGKSSLYNALKSFFEASFYDFQLKDDEFRFLHQEDKGTVQIKIWFKDLSNLQASGNTEYFVKSEDKNNQKTEFQYIAQVMPFVDYKALLKTHYLQSEENEVDIFKLLVEELLYYKKNEFNSESTIGKDWKELDKLKHDSNARNKNSEFNELLLKFTNGLKQALEEIEDEANEILIQFKSNLEFKLEVGKPNITGQPKNREWTGANVFLRVKYNGEKIASHQNFLNEARLSSIAISIYLASIKKMPQNNIFKTLVLDDILIGLDNSNRIPLLEILTSEKFNDYQFFITTYDRHWFETSKKWFDNHSETKWKYYELFTGKNLNNFEIPKLVQSSSNLSKALMYMNAEQPDYGAAGNYMRKACEKAILDKFPEKALKEPNGLTVTKLDQLIVYAEKFYDKIGQNTDIFSELKTLKDALLNPLSHNDTLAPISLSDLKRTEKTLVELEKIEDMSSWEFETIVKEKTPMVLKLNKGYGMNTVNIYEFELKTPLWKYKKEETEKYHLSFCKAQGITCYEIVNNIKGDNHNFTDIYNSLKEFYKETVKFINEKDGGTIPSTYEEKYLEFFYISGTDEQKLSDIILE